LIFELKWHVGQRTPFIPSLNNLHRDSIPTEANTPFVAGAIPQENQRSGIGINIGGIYLDLYSFRLQLFQSPC